MKNEIRICDKIHINARLINDKLSTLNFDGKSEFYDWIAEQALVESLVLCNSNKSKKNGLDMTAENHKSTMQYVINSTFLKNEINHDIVCEIHKKTSLHTDIHRSAGFYSGRGGMHNNTELYNKSVKEMQNIFDYINCPDIPVLSRAFYAGYRIRRAQAFDEHNKRTGRFVMNLILIQHDFTPVFFNINGDREIYYNALNNPKTSEYENILKNIMLRSQGQVMRKLSIKAH